ncbi:hypothetical protein NL445_29605, partial [Klebsiella pneumoniae]|nr:hypothetical protein [Klebsiella pneumoniae]
KNSLECMDSVATLAGVPNTELSTKVISLENENKDLKKAIDDLRNLVISLQVRVETLESSSSITSDCIQVQSEKPAAA